MATHEDIQKTYDIIDETWRAALGEHADITCGIFGTTKSKTLQDAQLDKHSYILNLLRFQHGHRVLDIGCGWGALLLAIRERGGFGVGNTLSSAQVQICKAAGLEVYLTHWRDLRSGRFGLFDSAAAVGSIEHFCSPEDFYSGKQIQVYRAFFEICHERIRKGGRLYVQTMHWGQCSPSAKSHFPRNAKVESRVHDGSLVQMQPRLLAPYQRKPARG